mgnify:CR=1 FL=1
MRLAILTNSISTKAGGLQNIVRCLSEHLCVIPNINVEILSIIDKETPSSYLDWKSLSLHLFQAFGPSFFNYSYDLGRYLRANAFDIYHLHGIWQYIGLAGARSAASGRKPFVVSPHGMLDPWALNHSRWKKILAGWLYENRNLRNTACLHALCESEYKSIRVYGLRNPICIIPNGVELPDNNVKNLLASSFSDYLDGRKLLLFLSRIHPKKGLENLLHAWSLAIQRTPATADWVLGIAGWDQGGHEQELKSLADELGIEWSELGDWTAESVRTFPSAHGAVRSFRPANLLFLGPAFNERKDALLRSCSAFILPSFSEGMPVAVLEAWSYGKPVIMTPACNLPEGFTAGAALKTDPEVGSIALAIANMLNMSEQERLQMGNNGRRLVENHFTWPEIARKMKSVYDWLLGAGSKPDWVVLD